MPNTKIVATFWSMNSPLSPVSRYHLGQLSVAQYVDEVVRDGGSHHAIICDNEGLGRAERMRIHEIGSAINCLCDQALVVRTFAAYAEMGPQERTFAVSLAERFKEIKTRMREAYPPARIKPLALQWRSETISDAVFHDAIRPTAVISELKNLPIEQICGLVYLLCSSPTWYDDFWFVSILHSLGRLSHECEGPIEIVEGRRNRYVWLAVQAAVQLLAVPIEWMRWAPRYNFRPNIVADGSKRYMCLDEIEHALLVHASQAEVLRFCESSSDGVANSISNLLLGREVVRDRHTLGSQLWDLLANVQDRWFFGTPPVEPSAAVLTVDPLLGIYDRGKFQRDMSQLLTAADAQRPVALLMIDLDHFKQVNDTYGHPVGDKVLVQAASLIKKTCDGKGFCYRYGGEEIAVIAPNFAVGEANALGERIREIISATAFGECSRKVTVSIGVAACSVATEDGTALVSAADRALYDAKNSGRNRVCNS